MMAAGPGVDVPAQLQLQPSGTCGSPGPAGSSCCVLDSRLVVVLVVLGGAAVLLLLYRLLQLRHRLRLALARNALEYRGFYRHAAYTLCRPPSRLDLPAKTAAGPGAPPPVQTVTAVTPAGPPPPPPPSPPPPPLPPPPPSPHLSWGACSDPDVYSRIGAFRPASRLSSLSSQSKVILFEHSSL